MPSAASRPRNLVLRLFLVLFGLMICAPLVTQTLDLERLVSKKKAAGNKSENRDLAEAPSWPATLDDALAVPGKLDRYLVDNFGLRRPMIEANDRLRWVLFRETASPKLLVGRNGRLFLDTPGTPYDSVQTLCGLGVPPMAAHQAAGDLRDLIERFRPLQAHLLYLLVPTAPTLYPEDLPLWLQRQCLRVARPADVMAKDLDSDPSLAANFFYPLELMRGLTGDATVIPKTNFHWEGTNARFVAEAAMREKLGLDLSVDIKGRPAVRASDLTRFNPGAGIENRIAVPDYTAAGVRECQGAECFPELGEIGGVLQSLSRFTRAAIVPNRALILSDSFGANIAGYFSEGYSEVWHFSTNNFDRLDDEQVARFKRVLWQGYRPDSLILIYHDGSALINPRALLQRFFPDAEPTKKARIRLED